MFGCSGIRWRAPALGLVVASLLAAGVATAGSAMAAPPQAVDDAAVTVTNNRVAIHVLDNDTDPDGDKLTITSQTGAQHAGLSCRADDGVCTYTPEIGYVGPDSFTYTVSDGHGGTSTAKVSVSVNATLSGRPPVAATDTVSTIEGTTVSVNVLANDSDPDEDRLTLTSSTAATYGDNACASDGRCTYRPDPAFAGPDSFTYTVSDGRGGISEGTVKVTVSPLPGRNHTPAPANDEVTTAMDAEVAFDVLANDADADGDTLTLSLTGQDQQRHGSVSCRDTGLCVYRPEAGFVGKDSFGYSVSDGHGGRTSATVFVSVFTGLAGDRQPVVTGDSVTTNENTPVTVAALANDSDPDGDTLLLFSATSPSYGSVDCTPGGRCAYTPDRGFAGPDSFRYTVSDGRGGLGSATVRITVTPTSAANHAPAAVADQIRTVRDASVAVAPLSNDVDADGDRLVLAGNGPVTHGSVTCNPGSLVCVYTPAAGYVGLDMFDYQVSDGRGGVTSSSVSIQVAASQGTNRIPQATDDVLTLPAGGRGTVTVTANDTDPDGDQLVVMATSAPAHGDVSCTASGQCGYVPAAGYSGADTFTYTVSDGQGGVATARVQVTVQPVAGNRAPVTRADSVTTAYGTAVSGNVLANDRDPDGDRLSVTSATTPANGTATCAPAGQCTYTPRTGFSGTDTFRYTVSDGRGGSGTGTVTVTVSAPPAACQPVWWWPFSWFC